MLLLSRTPTSDPKVILRVHQPSIHTVAVQIILAWTATASGDASINKLVWLQAHEQKLPDQAATQDGQAAFQAH